MVDSNCISEVMPIIYLFVLYVKIAYLILYLVIRYILHKPQPRIKYEQTMAYTTALIYVNDVWFAIIFYSYILDIVWVLFFLLFLSFQFSLRELYFQSKGNVFNKKNEQEGPWWKNIWVKWLSLKKKITFIWNIFQHKTI